MLALVETVVLAAHLMCVNVAAGGPLVAAWLDWRGSRGDGAAARAAAFLGRAAVGSLLVGAALGFFLGWMKWTDDYRDLWLGPLAYKLRWAALEAVFSLVLLIAWWLWLPGRVGGSFAAMWLRGLVAVLAATNLLYHFPVLFSVADRLYAAGQTAGPTITGAAFHKLMIEAETPALAVHVTLASVAVAAVALLGMALGWLQRGESASATRLAVWAARIALLPTILQVPVGLWTLAALPAGSQARIMGETAAGTLLLLGALLAAFWLVNDLVRVALGEVTRLLLVRVMAAMLVTAVLMTAMQRQTRGGPVEARGGTTNHMNYIKEGRRNLATD